MDGREAGQFGDQAPALQHAADRLRSDESHAFSLQTLTHIEHEAHDLLRIRLGRIMRGARLSQRCPRPLARVTRLPFVNPSTRAGDKFQDMGDRFAFVKELEELAPQAPFVRFLLVHPTTLKVALNKLNPLSLLACEKSVHDVVTPLLN